MAFEVKRKAELTLVGLLGELLPDFNFYPSKGGDDEGGVTLPRPPFGAIWIDNAEKTMGQQNTYLLSGSVVWVSRESKDDVVDQSDTVKQIHNALLEIGTGVDPIHNIMVHGLDIGLVNEFNDNERQAHGDVISFTMGVSELD